MGLGRYMVDAVLLEGRKQASWPGVTASPRAGSISSSIGSGAVGTRL